MIDRRFFVAALLVAVGVFALRAVTTGSPDPVAESSSGDQAIAFDPLPEVALAPSSIEAESVEEQPSTSTIPVPDTAAQNAGPAAPSTVSEADVLVESRRPAIDAVQVPPDHDHDDGELAAPGSDGSAPIKQVAAELVVAGWTWRFDDADTRQVNAITPIATGDAVETLVPSADELQRRTDTGEVSWVIVRNISVDGAQATVTFDQHLVTSSSAETVISRVVVVYVVVGVALEVRF